jgi:hypothetical protein
MTDPDAAKRPDVTIPVMFGDGRTRRIGYRGIKGTHAPNLVITEVAPVKLALMETAERMRAGGEGVDEVRLAAAIALIDAVVLEAAEALASAGNGWPEPGEPLPDETELVRRYRAMPVLLTEEAGIRAGLERHAESLAREGKADQEARVRGALAAIGRLIARARQGPAETASR